MKVKLVKPTVLSGEKHRTGSVHVLEHARAVKLIKRGYAEVYSKEEKIEETPEDGDPVSS